MERVELCFQEVPCHAWAHFASLVKLRIGNNDMSAQSSESLWESEEKVSIIGDRLYTLFALPFRHVTLQLRFVQPPLSATNNSSLRRVGVQYVCSFAFETSPPYDVPGGPNLECRR
jgi:hypothetical protein